MSPNIQTSLVEVQSEWKRYAHILHAVKHGEEHVPSWPRYSAMIPMPWMPCRQTYRQFSGGAVEGLCSVLNTLTSSHARRETCACLTPILGKAVRSPKTQVPPWTLCSNICLRIESVVVTSDVLSIYSKTLHLTYCRSIQKCWRTIKHRHSKFGSKELNQLLQTRITWCNSFPNTSRYAIIFHKCISCNIWSSHKIILGSGASCPHSMGTVRTADDSIRYWHTPQSQVMSSGNCRETNGAIMSTLCLNYSYVS